MIRKITLTLLAAICILSADVFAQSSRLIATNTIRFNTSWAPYDSVTFAYPTGLGGDYWDLINHRLPYDTSVSVGWNGTNWQTYQSSGQNFDGNNRFIERLTYMVNGTTITNNQRVAFTRDGNGNVLEELTQNWNNNAWENYVHRVRTYDGNNNIITSVDEFWNTTNSNWVGSSYLTVYTYDGNNNMTSNVSATYNTGTSQFDSTYRNVFHYTNNLNDTSWGYSWNSGWQPGSRTTYTYNGNNLNDWYLIENWVSNNWENSSRSFSLFITSNVVYGDSLQNWVNNSWKNSYRSTNAYDLNYNSVRYLWEVYDTANNVYVNNFIDSAAFNSFDQVTWNKKQKWDTTTHTWTGSYAYTENRYYYELYTAGVKNITQSAGDMKIFPSPARNYVNIDMKWNEPQDFVVAIFDIQGRILRQWSEKATNEYKRNVPLAGITAGTYILQIRGKDATVQEQFVIMD